MLNALAIVAPAFTLSGAVGVLIYLIVAALVFGLIWFIISKLPVPEPIRSWLFIALYILAALVAIFWLLSLVGAVGIR